MIKNWFQSTSRPEFGPSTGHPLQQDWTKEMDPAGDAKPTFHRHDQILSEILWRLSEQPASPVLNAQVGPADISIPPLTGFWPESWLPAPERCDGNPERCCGFFTQWTLAFRLTPNSFPTESSKVAFIITFLTRKALDWATAQWEQPSPLTESSEQFIKEMKKVFHHPTGGEDIDHRLIPIS